MLPDYVKEILAKSFTAEQMVVIEQNWDDYAQISFNSATKAQLKKTAQMVLDCATR